MKENLNISQGKKQSIDVKLEITEVLENSYKDYKAVIIIILLELKVNPFEMDGKNISSQKRNK